MSEKIKKEWIWKDAIQKLSLAGTHTEARATNQTHLYGIWVNKKTP